MRTTPEGAWAWIPLCLDAALCLPILWLIARISAEPPDPADPGVPADPSVPAPLPLAAWTLAAALVIPLPTLVAQGMEHPLHTALWLTILWRLPALLDGADRRDRAAWPALALLSVATRYEALFGVAAAAFLLAARGRYRAALSGLAAGIAPILAYGLWLRAQGWPFLPAGALVKTAAGQPNPGARFLAALIKMTENLYYAGPLLVLIFLALAWIWPAVAPADPRQEPRQSPSDPARARAAAAALAALAHTALGGFGHAFRYEAWVYAGLLAALIPAARAALRHRVTAWLPGALAAALLALALGQRAGRAWWDIPRAARDIAAQQGRMAAYAAQHHAGEVVVANDIGLLAWEGRVRVLDIAGLGSLETLEMRRRGLDRGARALEIGRLAREQRARVAMVYTEWLGEIPAGWSKIESWTVEDPTVLGGPTVDVYRIE